jgi:hypothetical protein
MKSTREPGSPACSLMLPSRQCRAYREPVRPPKDNFGPHGMGRLHIIARLVTLSGIEIPGLACALALAYLAETELHRWQLTP